MEGLPTGLPPLNSESSLHTCSWWAAVLAELVSFGGGSSLLLSSAMLANICTGQFTVTWDMPQHLGDSSSQERE